MAEASLGAAHPDAIVTLANYGLVLRKLGRKVDAKRVEAHLRELRTQSRGNDPGDFAVDWRELHKRAR